MDGDDMENLKIPKKTISDIVRKMIKKKNISIKKIANYLNCTEQSFRNKLSRNSFSIKDIMIIAYVCDATVSIDYAAYTDDFDTDFLNISQYLPDEEFERIEKLKKRDLLEELVEFGMTQDISNMSDDELKKIIDKKFNGKIQIV